jgi:tetratricopeptide (TPR) repeat protein
MEGKDHSVQRNMRILKVILLLGSLPLFSQNIAKTGDDYRKEIYEAYLESKMDRWKEVLVEMESRYRHSPEQNLLYDICETSYGYIAWCISVKKKREAETWLDQAQDYLNTFLKMDGTNARAWALQGAFYGFRVGLEPLKAAIYGKRSYEANERALRLNPREPHAWMEKANIAFYKPAVFGGSDREAVPLYEKAVRLFETTPGRTEGSWIYLNCLAGLGIALEKTGQGSRAGEVYRKILRLEPSFRWVRDELYPEYMEKQKG